MPGSPFRDTPGGYLPAMPRLRRTSAQQPGWRRVAHGRGFRYLDTDGGPLPAEDVARVRALVIPPAWRDVWVCPFPNGHLQAVGTDDAGRRQYLYHPRWRELRDEAKHARVVDLGRRLPRLRRRLVSVLESAAELPHPEREHVLAAAIRLVDLGCFRLGSEVYAETNASYGLTTLERRHLRRQGDGLVFSFVGKSAVEHEILVSDLRVCQVLSPITRVRRADARVLSYREGRRWVPLVADEVNAHLRELVGFEVTAKDFRTWHGTVHAAAVLAEAPPARTARGRASQVRAAMVSTSELLGNTPTVARSSYVDPRVVDLFEHGTTIADVLPRLSTDPDRRQDQLDRAVVRLLGG